MGPSKTMRCLGPRHFELEKAHVVVPDLSLAVGHNDIDVEESLGY